MSSSAQMRQIAEGTVQLGSRTRKRVVDEVLDADNEVDLAPAAPVEWIAVDGDDAGDVVIVSGKQKRKKRKKKTNIKEEEKKQR